MQQKRTFQRYEHRRECVTITKDKEYKFSFPTLNRTITQTLISSAKLVQNWPTFQWWGVEVKINLLQLSNCKVTTKFMQPKNRRAKILKLAPTAHLNFSGMREKTWNRIWISYCSLQLSYAKFTFLSIVPAKSTQNKVDFGTIWTKLGEVMYYLPQTILKQQAIYLMHAQTCHKW